MSILDMNNYKKQSIVYLIVSLFCFIFGLIYESFSHNVYSTFMMYSFLIPLVFGFIFSLVIYLLSIRIFLKRLFINLYNAGIATITIGCYLKGVLDIYGTTNQLLYVYFIVGGICLAVGFLSLFKR